MKHLGHEFLHYDKPFKQRSGFVYYQCQTCGVIVYVYNHGYRISRIENNEYCAGFESDCLLDATCAETCIRNIIE